MAGQQLDWKLAQVANHEIGAAVTQRTAVALAGDSDHEAEAAAATGLNAGLCRPRRRPLEVILR